MRPKLHFQYVPFKGVRSRTQKDVVYIVYVMRGERGFRNEDLLEREKL